MWHDMFALDVPTLEKVLRTVLVYGAIVILLRVAGKRDLAELNTLDLVVMLLLSNVVQNAVIGDDDSLVGGVLGAAVLIGANSLIVRAGLVVSQRYPRLNRWLEGTSTALIKNGRVDRKALLRLGLRHGDVVAAAHRQGADSVNEVREMLISPGGTILVRLKPEEESANRGDVADLRRRLMEIQSRLDTLAARLPG
ncbi:DUF421 domain-containing protein [Bailinhaonella thermotolerans]|uniref:DUF421 domain-containing protein n=1 Tax=Bailinhaonella thermotolerans TaxID=1070861 RepID=A0A3A4BL86_9ACTN|nr:YetF domain-containing protein [Bailinhaonella thermotolerans]RJL31802.1 DUF421 domain-containing protein [Bailinhaonella thermotolerans]